MATQTSQLVTNLQAIYNEKLLIKQAIPTTSDNFMDYHTYISALHPSGTSYISANGLSDVSSYQFAYVTVEGGGSGSSADPWYDMLQLNEFILEGSGDYVGCSIDENFEVTLDENEENVEAVEWDCNTSYYDEQNDEEVYIKVHIIINSDPHEINSVANDIAVALDNYPELYEGIYPILQDLTLTPSQNPTTDGYDYLIEAGVWNWNVLDCTSAVDEVTSNSFIQTGRSCNLGLNVNVSGGE